jgi:hypothetical protein
MPPFVAVGALALRLAAELVLALKRTSTPAITLSRST